MKEWIIEAEESTLFYLLKNYKPLTRAEMIYRLGTLIKQKNQLSLF